MKEEKLFGRKYTIDALADPATVDFGCVISSGQSKNDNIIEVDKLIDCLFSFCSILKFC